VKVSSPRTTLVQLYSNRCGARRMHWRLKQQGISCMTANGSHLTRFLRAAPSSPALAFHSCKLVVVLVEALDSWKQGPAISRSSRAQLCLARSVICLLLPPHSETYERLFDNCRLYNRGDPVACMADRHHPSYKPLHHSLPLFKRNCPALVVDAKRSRGLAGKQVGGAEPSLLASLAGIPLAHTRSLPHSR
jgi:hypothetical protein